MTTMQNETRQELQKTAVRKLVSRALCEWLAFVKHIPGILTIPKFAEWPAFYPAKVSLWREK
jgi:hypothetical protein